MRGCVCWLLFVLPLSAALTCPDTPTSLTVLLDFERPHSKVPLEAMQMELSHLLLSSGMNVDLKLKDELPPNPQFGELLIFKMKGHCGADQWPIGALSDERGPLAMTYSSDGTLLSFGEVECDHVRFSLQRFYRGDSLERHESAYGIALGRVVAHEIYHMIVNSKHHTREGVTKRSLAARELAQGALTMPKEFQSSFHK